MTVIDTDVDLNELVNGQAEIDCDNYIEGWPCPSVATWMGVPVWTCTCELGPTYACDRCQQLATTEGWRACCHHCRAPILGFRRWERIR